VDSPVLNNYEIGQRLLLAALLIGINAFFVTIEFAVFSVRRSRIAQLVESGDIQARQVQRLQKGIERLLSTTQLGITLSSLALGWIGERALSQVLSQWIIALPIDRGFTKAVAHGIAIPVTFILLAYLQIVFGELIPKSVALTYAEKISRLLGTPSLTIARIFSPPIWVLDRSTRLVLKLFGIENRADDSFSRVSFKELQTIVTFDSHSTGKGDKQRELIANVFEFTELVAAAIMVPRTKIVSIDRTDNLQTLLELVTKTGYSRYPVTQDSLDRIVGVISFKDLAPQLAGGKVLPQMPIVKWIKPIQVAAESTPVREILMMMQSADTKMTAIVDEFGNTAGLISRQDTISTLLGLERVSIERQATQIQAQGNGYIVQAQIDLDYLNRTLGLDLPIAPDYQTLAGFLLYQWQQIPAVGESLNYDNWEFTVIAIVGPRIDRVRLQKITQ
jgi:CBS domain containing-hemolysin-like protein